MAKATGLIFSLFNVISTQEIPLLHHCTYNAFFIDLPEPSFLSHSTLLTTKSINFVVGTWWLPFITEIVHNFHSCYFDCKSYFLLYNRWNIAGNKASSFQTIIKVHSVIVLMQYAWGCAAILYFNHNHNHNNSIPKKSF